MNSENVKSSNIISFGSRRMAVSYPAVSQVEAYWEGLRNGASVPMRSDIDPRGLEGALHHAFVLERIAPTVARFRLAGMHLTDLMGMEVRGMPLTAIFLPDARRAVGEAIERCLSKPAKVTLLLSGEHGIGRAALEARMALLPLMDDVGVVTRVLGCLESRGPIGRQPRRLDITESRFADIPVVSTTSAQPGFAELPREPFTGPQSAAKRPALRLVSDQDED